MLEGKNSSGHQHGHLLAIGNGFKRSAYSDFGFSEAYITTDQSVHRHWALHVFFDGFRSRHLVRSILKKEARLQFMLQVPVRCTLESYGLAALCVQLDQIEGNLFDLRLRLLLQGLPLR